MSSPRLSITPKSTRKLVLPNAVVAIRGTEFLARVGQGDDKVILFNGLISVENPKFIRDLAKPNFGVSISEDGSISTPQFISDKALRDILEALVPTEEQDETTESTSSSSKSSSSPSQNNSQDKSENTESEVVENEGEAQTTETTVEEEPGSEASVSEEAAVEPQPVEAASDANTEASPIETPNLESLNTLATSETAIETPVITTASITVDNQITQELNEVLETVSAAVTEEEATPDPSATDSDGDGVVDSNDDFPNDSSETIDTDNDGIGNNADNDDDGDGVADSSDAFPLDGTETADSDGDGTGDNADTLDNSRLYKMGTQYSQSGWTSSSWNDLAAQIGSGTATFTSTDMEGSSVGNGTECTSCIVNVDTKLTIDFSDMDYNFNAETTFTKPGYGTETFSAGSGDIPLGQHKTSQGAFSSSGDIYDLESKQLQNISVTFTSTTDPADEVITNMSSTFYYDAYQSDINDISTTQLGVRGYTKTIYDDVNSNASVDQFNTTRYSLDPQ